MRWIATIALLLLATTAHAQPVKPALGGTGCPNDIALASLTTYAKEGALCMVNNAEDASDCNPSGTGSTVTLCCYSGGSWNACGGGGGSAGGIEAVGNCVSGPCLVDGSAISSLTIEGSTVDEFETVLALTDPVADATITVPNETGQLCTTAGSAACDAVYSEVAHAHDADITRVGDCLSAVCFNGAGTGNEITFEGAVADDDEIVLVGAEGVGSDYTVTIPAETGTLCSDVSALAGCGKVNGPATSTNRALATYSGTDGKNLRDSQCTVIDTDGDASSLGDQIICTGGFLATDRNLFATPASNSFTLIDNDVDITPNPSCTDDCATGELCLLDTDESAADSWHWCEGTTDLGALIGGNESVFFGTGAMSVDATQCTAPAEVTINSGPKLWTTTCADSDAATIYGNINMPDSYSGGTVTFELEGVNLNAAPAGITEFDFACQCRSDSDVINASWGTEIAAAITWTTQYDEEHATTAVVTCNGTCAAGDTLYWRGQLDATASTTTQAADIRITGAKMEFPTALVAD